MAVITKCLYKTKVPAGQIIFTSSQVWTIPRGVKTIDIFCVGGGGSGNSGITSTPTYDYGGGGGYTATKLGQAVTSGQSVSVTVGSGGALAVSNGLAYDGGSSSFGAFLTALGGHAGNVANSGNAGAGGSGSGMGVGQGGSTVQYGHLGTSGGSDGSDGYWNGTDGVGQHTTTRAFAEVGNTLYAGGGGGGGSTVWADPAQVYAGGAGGAGGGGAGGSAGYVTTLHYATNGTPNTGGGGGGACHGTDISQQKFYGGLGGSGVVIVRWNEQ